MALQRKKPTEVKGGDNGADIEYENLPVGDNEGRLVMVADLGLQKKEYKGEHKGNFQQLALGIEMVGKTYVRDGEEFPVMLWTSPFYVYETLTEKGKELQYASVFDSSVEEGQVFDWDAHLGDPVNVVVKHTKKEDKTYDNIARLSAIPEKYKADVAKNEIEPVSGDGENVVKHLFGLTRFVYDKRIHEEEAVADAESANPDPDDDFDDDLPF